MGMVIPAMRSDALGPVLINGREVFIYDTT